MAYPIGKPARNRLTKERMRGECASRNHALLELKHPLIKVRCHCGNEYEQKIHSYKAAKNSCKKCNSKRKSKPRPEHALAMTGDGNPSKRKDVRQKISEKTKGPRPHLVGVSKNWKPRVLEERSKWMSEMRGNGTITSPGNIESTWKPTPEQRLLPGTLYLIRYLDEAGTHFKLGITKKKLLERFSAKRLISVIQTWNFPLGKCFDLEQATLRYASQHGHRYSSPTTTELIRPEGILPILEFIEHSLDDDGYVAQS
jgi:DNA-directed RNA polymerase subunit RPC12/RpoP